jgi:2-methylcitrate dehydratase PrpD
MSEDHDPIEAEVESFIDEFSYEDLADEDLVAAKRLLKDNLAVSVGLSVLPWSEAADGYAREQEQSGPSTVAAHGRSVDPETAAFLNGTFAHGLEYDDAHGPSDGHPGSVVTSTALAVGEAVDATFYDVLAAQVVGYEVYTELGAAGSPDLIARGWHPHAVLGSFGGAATAAYLWDLDRAEIRHALAIAASHASGLTEYSSTGGSVKRTHAGIGARNGITAVRMAKNGITGPRRYLTGNKGFFPTFIEKREIDPVDFGTPGEMGVHEAWLKQYACCGCTHAYVDCVEAIDPEPEDIESVTARIQPKSNSIVGTENENLYEPTNIEEAQFNLPFEVALAIRGHGNGFPAHRRIIDGDLALDDSELRETMQRIDLEPDPELGETYGPKFVGDLTVEYRDGTTEHAFVEDATGTADNPPSATECREKFDELTVPVLGEETSEHLWRAVDDADRDTPISRITSQMS